MSLYNDNKIPFELQISLVTSPIYELF